MKLYETHADLDEIQKRIEQKLIKRTDHLRIPGVRIYNYTQKAQFDNIWDEHIMQCRGLITDADGKILARPFPKFFNHDQVECNWNQPYSITEKLDGSMFLYSNGVTATRGSFTSNQCIWGTELLKSYDLTKLDSNYSYVFELLHPQNRIVINYGDIEKLILLAMIETSTGVESSYTDLQDTASSLGMEVIQRYELPIQDSQELLNLEEDNGANGVICKEGFVVRFNDGLRVKIKFSGYKILHKIISECSAKSIWEYMRDDRDINCILDVVPEDKRVFIQKTISDLTREYKFIEESSQALYRSILHLPTRKDQALALLCRNQRFGYVVFMMLSGDDPRPLIYKMIEPTYSPFKVSE